DQIIEKEKPAPARLHLVDLRQEHHAFINWRAVSWFADKDWANVWQQPVWIEEDERRRIDRAAAVPTARVFSYDEDKNSGRISPTGCTEITVASAVTERMVAEEPGWLSCPVSYHRLPVTDHCPPFEMLEPFITLFTQIDPAKDWVHFHCHGGDGRTTTFLALYDMAYWATVYGLQDFPKQFDKFAERHMPDLRSRFTESGQGLQGW